MRCALRATVARWLCVTFALLAALSPARAQENIGPMVYTVGTTWREMPANRDWAYLLWLGNDTSLLNGQTFAIYAKPGNLASPSPYQRVAIVSSQSDTHVIEPLLQRAAAIGEDLNKLETDIDALFGKFAPAGLTRAEKVSAVIRGAVGDEQNYGKLMLLARTHPSMAMALGVGHAHVIGPGLTTFEVRQFNKNMQQDVAVIGRVTVEAGAPTVLPAPGAPVQVPMLAARGDLNVQLRWATPDGLRRLALLQHGYDVFRVRKDFAEAPARNWHVTPPTPTAMNNALLSTSAVRRVNTLPLLTSKFFTAADVANFVADPKTMFIIDTDDRGLPNYIPTDYTNGARFYYFVAARDILGRHGTNSPGTLVLICDQLPPHALDKIEVVNDYVYTAAGPKHHLRVIWQQASNTPTSEEKIQRYWIYRWTNSNEVLTKQSNSALNLIAMVPHDPLNAKNSYLDNGPGSPTTNNAMGKVFWYTVRAEDSGACGGNLSPHSAPVPGTLRDRVGPAGPTGTVRPRCLEPDISVLNAGTNGSGSLGVYSFTMHGIRQSSEIQWIEMRAEVRPAQQTNILASYYGGVRHFAPGATTNDWMFTVDDNFGGDWLWVFARCGSADGKVSSWQPMLQSLTFNRLSRVEFNAIARMTKAKDDDCGKHYPVDPGSNDITPVDIQVIPTLTTREMRLYRRVDDGPLTLICQKTLPPPPAPLLPFLCQDDSFPSSATEICYYAQLFDEHGNPSPLVRLGCILIVSPVELPRPMLSPITPIGTDASPGMILKWFCAPAGVERFEVGIAGTPEQLGNDPALGQLIATGGIQTHTIPKTIPTPDGPLVLLQQIDFKIFRTPRIGSGSSFGNGAEFSLPVNIKAGGKYTVFVKAVGRDGSVGERSNIERFSWAPPTTNVLPTVSWPPRPLPDIGNSFNLPFLALWQTNNHNNYTGACVLIGYYTNFSTVGDSDFTARPQWLRATLDPMDYLFKRPDDTKPFPVALYRYQVANARFPNVSGDVIQCSPLMETIAYQRTTTNAVTYAIIHDQFVIFDGIRITLADRAFSLLQTFLKDTQPVVSGARYKYLLVRFQRNGEIAEVIPTNEMEVP